MVNQMDYIKVKESIVNIIQQHFQFNKGTCWTIQVMYTFEKTVSLKRNKKPTILSRLPLFKNRNKYKVTK